MILALYGAGAMGREFKYMADAGNEWAGVVFIDDHAISEELMGCPVLGFQKFCGQYRPEEVRFVIAIGEPRVRKEAYEKMKRAGYEGAILREPTAYISPDAEVGEATAVCRGAFIGSLARVGRNVYLSAGTAVGHDSVIGDHTRLGVHAFVGGHTVVGENVFVGSGAMLRDRIQIGDGSIIGLGAAVFHTVPDHVTMIGNPARISGESGDRPVYGVSTAAAEHMEEKPERATAEDAQAPRTRRPGLRPVLRKPIGKSFQPASRAMTLTQSPSASTRTAGIPHPRWHWSQGLRRPSASASRAEKS